MLCGKSDKIYERKTGPDCVRRRNARVATRGLDFDPGIRITFLGGTDDGDDGASDVSKYTYDSI